MKTINLEMDEELHAKAKVIAFMKRTTLKDYVHKAIEEATKRDNALLPKMK